MGREKVAPGGNARVIIDEDSYSTMGCDLSRCVWQSRSVMGTAERCEEDLPHPPKTARMPSCPSVTSLTQGFARRPNFTA
jgi:hypothetical protein